MMSGECLYSHRRGRKVFAVTFLVVCFLFVSRTGLCAVAEQDKEESLTSERSLSEPASFHIIFSTECSAYFDWQSLGLLHSYVKTKQKGKITRLMACDDANYIGENLTDPFPNAETYVHRNYRKHPVRGDEYPAYNKPYSVLSWLNESEPEEDFIVFLDADMVIRSEISIEVVGAKLGRPVSAEYGYLKGVDPDSYMEIKESVPNVDKADKVGGFMVMHKEDMKKVAPWWLHYTEEVRTNPKNWKNTGDVYNQDGALGPPWISEMYGYIFGCAHVNLKHIVSNDFMLYPGYDPPPEPFPLVIHYGITSFVNDYAFDKHWFDDLTSCPGTNIDYPLSLEEIDYEREDEPRIFRRDALALHAPQILHEALQAHQKNYCSAAASELFRYKYNCSDPDHIIRCTRTTKLQGEQLREEIQANKHKKSKKRGGKTGMVDSHDDTSPSSPSSNLEGIDIDDTGTCEDDHELCCSWAESGECDRNAKYMLDRCRGACGLCGKQTCPKEDSNSNKEEEEEDVVYSPNGHRERLRDGHFGRDRHDFHPEADDELHSNVFRGSNDALFRALPYWGTICVVGVLGVTAIQVAGPSLRNRFRPRRKRRLITV